MNIRIFQSDKGDCLLLTSADGKNILCDGGLAHSYSEHVAPALGKLHAAGEVLDLVYVSHIDQDHIGGVLKLCDDAVAWKVYDYQHGAGNNHFRKPKVPRPPAIRAIWHNAFHELVDDNAGDIESLLAARARLIKLSGALDVAEEAVELATSTGEAVRLSRRISAGQLNVPLNPEYGGKLMMRKAAPVPIEYGSIRFIVIGPAPHDLELLRNEWDEWLNESATDEALAKIRKKMEKDEENLGLSEFAALLALGDTLGARNEVTQPNLASLMVMAEETNAAGITTRMLLTGDGHWEDIMKGLDDCGFLDANGRCHIDVLKAQHHGAVNNFMPEFFQRLTADHYIFCGNGAHTNPEIEVLKLLLDSRVGPPARRSPNPKASNPFHVWFNSSSAVAKNGPNKTHMKAVEQLFKRAAEDHEVVSFTFMKKNKSEIGFELP